MTTEILMFTGIFAIALIGLIYIIFEMLKGVFDFEKDKTEKEKEKND